MSRDPRHSVEEERRSFLSGLDLLWETESAPLPPPRRTTLDRDGIVRAAIAIADAEGLEALSMRRIAAELGTGVMSLYRHVPDKEALLSLMLDAVTPTPPPDAPAPTGDWRAALRELASHAWALMRRHPWYAEATMLRPPLSPNAVTGLEYALSIFDDLDLDIDDRMLFVGSVYLAVLRAALNAAIDDRIRARLRMSDEEILTSMLAPYARRIAESGAYPRVTDFLLNARHEGEEAEMRAGIELILDGIAARIEARKRGRSGH
jgi:AcrR family transcriptional regulator